MQKYFFILGGLDNEMAEIKSVLEKHHYDYHQPQTRWGDIQVDMNSLPTTSQDKILVFIECRPSQSNPKQQFYIIDHHNFDSHKPSSLLQVLQLLKLTPTLKQQIIASIDSEFLYHTIKKFPDHKSEVIDIWESGYKKNFNSNKDYQEFKQLCQTLYAKSIHLRSNLYVLYQCPQSMTLLASMFNLRRRSCILIVGNQDSDKPKPCFFQGPPRIISKLRQINLDRKYSGRRYFGCRAIPRHFVNLINQIYASQN